MRLTAEQKEAERQFRAEEERENREVRREIAGGKEEGGELNDKESRRLYNEAYTKAYTAAMQGVVTASPQQQQAAEMKAHQYAAQLTGFDLYGAGGTGRGREERSARRGSRRAHTKIATQFRREQLIC